MERINYRLLFILLIILIAGYFISAYFSYEDKEIIKNEKDDSPHITSFPLPKTLEFAGENVPLEDIDLAERYDRELLSNVYFHSNTILMLKRSNRWFPQMMPVLNRYELPGDFIYLPLVESGLTNSRSPAGAVGFWQLTEGSAKELGLEVNSEVDERYCPLKSTEAACRFLVKAKAKFGSWTNAAASYNVGMNGLTKSMNSQKSDSYFDLLLNEETSRYIFRILAFKSIFEDPGRYGFYVEQSHLYEPEIIYTIEVKESINDLTEFAFQNGINYKILKRHNPWLRSNTLTIKSPGKVYQIQIPRNHPLIRMEDPDIADTVIIGDDRYENEELE